MLQANLRNSDTIIPKTRNSEIQKSKHCQSKVRNSEIPKFWYSSKNNNSRNPDNSEMLLIRSNHKHQEHTKFLLMHQRPHHTRLRGLCELRKNGWRVIPSHSSLQPVTVSNPQLKLKWSLLNSPTTPHWRCFCPRTPPELSKRLESQSISFKLCWPASEAMLSEVIPPPFGHAWPGHAPQAGSAASAFLAVSQATRKSGDLAEIET